MRLTIGVPKEIKDQEFRVALTPQGARMLVDRGHRVVVQEGAGAGSGFSDLLYQQAGAVLKPDGPSTYADAQLVVKVKEPQAEEYGMLRADHVLFTYLHLAASRSLTEALLASGCTAIAYETTEDGHGQFPLLRPMSEIAGRMSVQVGAELLERHHGGSGVLLSGVPGVPPGKVVIVGSGVVGAGATKIAVGMGADVTVLSLDVHQLRELELWYQGRVRTVLSSPAQLEHYLPDADLVIGAVYVPAARTPRVITRAMVQTMKPGSVIVDVSVDQGGCVETTHPTTHTAPTYVSHGVVHYAVPNIPGIVPYTSTVALTNATLPFIVHMLESGLEQAVARDIGLQRGVSVKQGRLLSAVVGQVHGLPWMPLENLP